MKKWLGDLKMTNKLLVSPIMAVLFLMIFGVVAYLGFFKQQAAMDDIFSNRFKRYQTTASVGVELREMHAKMQEAMTTAISIDESTRRSQKESQPEGESAKGAAGSTNADVIKQTVEGPAKEISPAIQRLVSTIQQISKSSNLIKQEKDFFARARRT